MKGFDPISYKKDDGLTLPDIGLWGIKKYKLFGSYCDIFTSGMKYKWDERVFIDLFSGAGYAKLRNDGKILMTSSLIAASVPSKFTKYIACDANEDNINSLKQRVEREFTTLDFNYFHGDANKIVDKIIDAIPKGSKTLNFCFVDPFSLDIEFETIKKIASMRRVDFLILLALQMDANRNFVYYINEQSTKIDKFIGNTNWREPFKEGRIHQKDFIKYLADSYDSNMKSIGYRVDPDLKFKIENTSNAPLYYLAYYSKSDVGNDFYKKVEKNQNAQMKMF